MVLLAKLKDFLESCCTNPKIFIYIFDKPFSNNGCGSARILLFVMNNYKNLPENFENN